MELKKLHIYNLNNVLYTISLLHISLGAMIFVSLFALHGSTSLKHTDNNYCLGNEVNYKCHSSINVLCNGNLLLVMKLSNFHLPTVGKDIQHHTP